MSNIASSGYRVLVQHAPDFSDDPATVVKYLARYASGVPICDKRIVSAENGNDTFLVRDNESAALGQPKSQVEITIPETVSFFESDAMRSNPPCFWHPFGMHVLFQPVVALRLPSANG